MKNPDFKSFEARHLSNTAAHIRQLRKAFEQAIEELTIGVGNVRFKGQVFRVADFPALKAMIDRSIERLRPRIYSVVVNGISSSWALANAKNDYLVDIRLAGKRPSGAARQIFYDPNKRALDSFIARSEEGVNLSSRVWKLVEPYKLELEAGLGVGISKGQPAKQIAADLKQYLTDPDRLFRRVRDAKGDLVLSKPAQDYHPGQGVYRSAYKNAVRLSRTETNMAYRRSDFERWQSLPFVTGIDVKLSGAHPRFDICDQLAGSYPKDFLFVGWHPQCLCYQVPKMMSDSEFGRLEDEILGIGREYPVTATQTQAPPAAFDKYLKKNEGILERLKSKPYWIRDNPQYTGG